MESTSGPGWKWIGGDIPRRRFQSISSGRKSNVAYRRECPAGPALTLVLDGCNSTLLPPVHRGWEFLALRSPVYKSFRAPVTSPVSIHHRSKFLVRLGGKLHYFIKFSQRDITKKLYNQPHCN